MKLKQVFVQTAQIVALVLVSTAHAQTDAQWEGVDDPEELRKLLAGRAMQPPGGGGVTYYRRDGKAAYVSGSTDTVVIREWIIKDNGDVCEAVYSRPDRVIHCLKIQRAKNDPGLYRSKGAWDSTQFRFVEPPKRLADAITEKAGVE